MITRPINVLFDASPLIAPQKTGVGYYTHQLIEAMAKKYSGELRLTGYYFNFLGRKSVNFDISLPNVSYRPIKYFPGIALPLLARRFAIQFPIEFFIPERYDHLLFPNFISLPSIRKTPSTIVVHDLGCFDCPEYLQEKNLTYLQRLLPKSIRRSNSIVTVSAFTKGRLLSRFPYYRNQVAITPIPPPNVQSKFKHLPHELEAMGLQEHKYILYLGTVEPRKNITGLVNAYQLLSEKLRNQYALVIAGGSGWKDESIAKSINSAIEAGSNIIRTGYVPDELKAQLYKFSSIFVLPSHYEGFGMPLLEAMSHGIPVAASDLPVFHEVCRDAAMYFDKDSPEDIASKIETLLTDIKLQKELIDKSAVVLGQLSWDKNAEKVYELIKTYTGQ